MNNLVILPILIPLLAAVLLIFMNKSIKLMRVFSAISSIAAVAAAAVLVKTVFTDGIQTLY
ncbi:Na+/H+ antiporter subunit D, partial [Klebsiella pneumoniae]|nr:Na+/H+ antiporter subunit D [Klebsiella pneumoniae]